MIGILGYIFVGYPIILVLLNAIIRTPKVKVSPSFEPTVTFLVSCFNEEMVIGDKLKNALAMDYLKDKIEILVISDGSTDRTDEIVSGFDDPRIRLLRMNERRGKTLGLNHAVAESKGDIIVFSDANAMYEPNALRMLIRHFAEPKIGYVVGEARYIKDDDGSSVTERVYWAYECTIKKIESKIHSVVGGDGAIYAIRKDLYEPLLESDINDFVNPLQIIAKGYRGIFEPDAVCWEDTAGSFGKEFKRKTRIVNRSFSGLLRVPSVMNPLKSGWFSFEVISHKLLRWLSPFFLMILLVVSLILAAYGSEIYTVILSMELCLLGVAYLGYLQPAFLKYFGFYYPYYFVAMNVASYMGVVQRIRGYTQVTWDTARSKEMGGEKVRSLSGISIHVGMVCLFILGGGIFLCSDSWRFVIEFFLKVCFWLSFYTLLYIYAFYPVIIQIWSLIKPKPVRKKEITPSVTLLVCAYNEEDVIAEKIENCLAIDYPKDKLSIVIASDGSSDKTNEIVSAIKDSRLKLIPYQERSGKIGAIIKTIPQIDSEIIVFSDANTMIDKDSIKRITCNFNDPEVGAVSTDVIVVNCKTSYSRSESLYYKYERWIQKKESSINSIVGVDGGLYAIRRSLYVEPSPDIILDDFVISMNTAAKGHRIVYDETAIGYEESEHSYLTEFSKKSRVVAGAFQALKKKEGLPPEERYQLIFCYISHKLLRWLTPVFLIVLYVSSLSLTIKTGNGYLIVFTLLQTLFYILASIGTWFKGPIKSPFIHIPFYFCLVNSAALYGIYKGILDKQSVKWKVFKRKGDLG